MKEVSWNEIGSGEFLTLEDGVNQLRVLSTIPRQVLIHWVTLPGNVDERVICPGPNNKPCPLCNMGDSPTLRYVVVVWDRKSKSMKIFEGAPSIFSSLKQLVNAPTYGDPRTYDIIISKSGKGRGTRYAVIPQPKSDLTQEEIKVIKASPINLEQSEAYRESSLEEMNEIVAKLGGHTSVPPQQPYGQQPYGQQQPYQSPPQQQQSYGQQPPYQNPLQQQPTPPQTQSVPKSVIDELPSL